MNITFPPWFRRRHYLHFDLPISWQAANSVVTDSSKVARHAFYPFICSKLTSLKQSKDEATGKIVRRKKEREVACSAHLDSHIYSFYSHQLSCLYESALNAKGIGDSVLAFRALGKSNIDFALHAFTTIQKRGPCHVIALDIRGFFDNLDHRMLKSAWASMLEEQKLPNDHFNVFKSLTNWCKVEKKQLFATLGISIHNSKKGSRKRICDPNVFRNQVRATGLLSRNEQSVGIPQGSPISAILSNIYMLGFDQQMHSFALSIGASYLRYCDDMLIICPSEKREEAKNYAHQCIKRVNLEIQDEKTDESTFVLSGGKLITRRPLQYLGFLFDGDEIRIRSCLIARYLERMRRGVKVAKNASQNHNEHRLRRAEKSESLYLKKIYRQYSYLGRRNFVSYGYRSANKMNSDSIRRQLKPFWPKLLKRIEAE